MNSTATKVDLIAKMLLLDKAEYLEQNMERYLRWCTDKSKQFDIDLQKVVANTAISNYYRMEFEKMEDEFLKEAVQVHGKVKYTTMRKMYNEHIISIFEVYPKPLLEAAQKLNIINHLYN